MTSVAIAGSRAVVTGGAGTIGSTIVDQLLDKGAEHVLVLDNFVRGHRRNLERAVATGRVTVLDADIRDRWAVSAAVRGADVVFHQAAIRITQCAEEPRLAHDVLASGTFNVLEACVEAGVAKVIAASSASVYGLAREFPTTEAHNPYANDTIYGAAKVYLEGLLRSFHATAGLDYVALRYFNVYGPRMDVHGVYTEVLIRWMERIAAGQPPLVLGDGAQTMDFVYTTDIARANLLAAEAEVTDVVLNIASGVETSLLELAQQLLLVLGRPELAVEHGPARAVNGVTRRLASTSAARDLIGFEAQVGLTEGLRELTSWWSSVPLEAVS
jgi:UDP-glucose 4-epimerase